MLSPWAKMWFIHGLRRLQSEQNFEKKIVASFSPLGFGLVENQMFLHAHRATRPFHIP